MADRKKLTKAQNQKVLSQFMNLCSTLKHVSQEFIVFNIEDILRKDLNEETRNLIAFKASAVKDEVENSETKIVLPPEWEKLVDLNEKETIK